MSALREDLSPERRAALEEEVARLNARAVVQRMEKMQQQMDDYKNELAQMKQQMAILRGEFSAQQQLIGQLLNLGSGPTVR